MIEQQFISIPDMIAIHARTRAAVTAWIDEGVSFTWRQFDQDIGQAADELAGRGVRRGDPVALLATSSYWTWSQAFGIMRANGVVTPLNAMLRPQTLAGLLSDAGARILLAGAGHEQLAREILGQLPPAARPDLVLQGAGGQPGPAGRSSHPARGFIEPGDAINIIYSSGATGLPKGIVHSHQARAHFAALTASMMQFRAGARTFVTTPPHTNGSWIMILPTIYVGGTTITAGPFSAGTFLQVLAEHRPTNVLLVPTMLHAIFAHPQAPAADWTCFDFIITGGSHTDPEEKVRIMDATGDRLGELWGLTEGVLTVMQPADMRAHLSSAGRVTPENDVRVIGEHGGELPFGEVGELVGRSTHLMLRYHNRPEATSELIWRSPDGLEYLRTGDLGTIDPDGWVTIRGRKKDMIKSGGLNVFPADIEPVLLAHEAVGECAVVGVPDPKWGETPVGFVVLSDGQAAGTGAIQEWVNERVEKTQRLRDVVIVSELPRNSIGKVIKGELRDQYGGTPVRSHRL